ncbi:hypothetical protein D3C84_685680 [compost metagenome]
MVTGIDACRGVSIQVVVADADAGGADVHVLVGDEGKPSSFYLRFGEVTLTFFLPDGFNYVGCGSGRLNTKEDNLLG